MGLASRACHPIPLYANWKSRASGPQDRDGSDLTGCGCVVFHAGRQPRGARARVRSKGPLRYPGTFSSIARIKSKRPFSAVCSTGALRIWPASRCTIQSAGSSLMNELGAHALRAAVFDPRAAPGQGERLPRAGDADVEQAALFIDGAFDLRAIVRQHAFFEADRDRRAETRALRRVQRDQRDAAALSRRLPRPRVSWRSIISSRKPRRPFVGAARVFVEPAHHLDARCSRGLSASSGVLQVRLKSSR